MSRRMKISVTVTPETDESDPEAGLGFTSYRDITTWSDEYIEEMSDVYADRLATYIKVMRDREIERDRKAAEPFWKKWIGGV